MPTVIIVYTALGRAAESTLETTSAALAHSPEPEGNAANRTSLVSHMRRDSPRFTLEDNDREVEQGCRCKHDEKASNSLVWPSDPGSTGISFRTAHQESSGESSGHTVTEQRPMTIAHALIRSRPAENPSAYPTSSNGLELGTSDKCRELTMSNDTPPPSGIQRTSISPEGTDLTTDSAGALEARTRPWRDGNYDGRPTSISAVRVVSGVSRERSISHPVTHPVPAAVHLGSLAPTPTTFEAYLAGLENANIDPRNRRTPPTRRVNAPQILLPVTMAEMEIARREPRSR